MIHEKISFRIVSPDGEEFDNVTNLREFCHDNNINYKNVRKTSYKGSSHKYYKGWKFFKNRTNFVQIPSEDNQVPEFITTTNNHEQKTINEVEKLSGYGLDRDELLLKLSDDNFRLKKQIKELRRNTYSTKILSGIIKENIVPYQYCPITNSKPINSKESLVLFLSDIHGDELVESEKVNGLEKFDYNVCCKRAEKLVNTIFNEVYKYNYQYEKLYILLGGDLVHGKIHNNVNQWSNDIKASMRVGEMICKMIIDLAQYFPKIELHSVSGNHGRFDKNKNYKESQINWDYLVASYVESKLSNLISIGELSCNIPDSWNTIINIYDKNILLSHGDDVRVNGFSYNNIDKRTQRMNSLSYITDQKIDYYFSAHIHNPTELTGVGTKIFINGSFVATDEFAYNSLALYNEPSQKLFCINADEGITWMRNVLLRTKDWKNDEQFKSRYNI